MSEDARGSMAREAHLASLQSEAMAGLHRDKRNTLVRALRADDPRRWSYKALAREVGCSPELIAVILKSE